MKTSSCKAILTVVITILFAGCLPDTSRYEAIKEGFLYPSGTAKPKVYWWCLNGNTDTARVKQELFAMKDAGIGGFDIFEIGVPAQDVMIPGGPAFLSDESLRNIKYVVDEAGKLDLTAGLNLASSWNAGGSWIEPRHGGKSLYVSSTSVKGNSQVQKIDVPFPEVSFPREMLIGGTDRPMIPFLENGKPVYHEEIAILAIPAHLEQNTLDTAQIIDVSAFFDSEKDELNWMAPPGDWEIQRYICSNSGQQLVRPSPLSAGLTIDHFDSTAVATHLNYIIHRLISVLGDFEKTALKSLYLASYEARGFVWTPSLSSEFRKVNGYDIKKFIPVLFNAERFSEETSEQVQKDFKKTLSELMINNLYRNAQQICADYGLAINCEAGGPGFPLYNGPAEPLKALGTLDIPRGEFWINHARYYKDSDGRDSIDILRVVKEVAAASHIYEKGIVEEEAFTSFQHWHEGPFDMKPTGDRAFCEGMNRVVFHGFSHNISGSGYPGYVYHAGTHFNDKRVWWPKAKPYISYLARLSSVFQQTDFTADVLWYYGDKIPNSATPKNAHFSVGPGYDYEVINTDILLNKLSIKDGKLVLSNGASFSLLALEDEEVIHPAVLIKLKDLANRGAVIVGERPQGIAQTVHSQMTQEDGKATINQLWGNTADQKAKIFSEVTPADMLSKLHVPPDFDYSDKETYLLDYIHYKKDDLDFFFVANTSNEWISRECSFRLNDRVPEIWDPVSGQIIPVSIYRQDDDHIKIPLTLAPYGSQLITFKNSTPLPHDARITSDSNHPPLLTFTEDGFQLLEEGKFHVTSQYQTEVINHRMRKMVLDGGWALSFPENWGAPAAIDIPALKSWTDSDMEGVRYFSGTATYNKTFQFNIEGGVSEKLKIYLDLGDLSKVGEVWLNGQHLGITWSKPHQFEVTNILKPGENHLQVEIANTWSNRLKGDAITGDNFTNTNIRSTVIPATGMLPGDQTRIPWADVPLIESGLFGPVTIQYTEKVEVVAVE